MSRRAAREVALRALFQVDVGRSRPERALEYNVQEMGLPADDVPFARRLVEGTLAHMDEVDQLIKEYAVNWSIDRMAKTDRNILRMAIYELLYEEDVPGSVTINEAVELAKTYGDADSSRFVNGILGAVLKNRVPAKVSTSSELSSVGPPPAEPLSGEPSP